MLEELKRKRDAELARIEDTDERMYARITWDLKINEAWENARKNQYAMTPEEVEAEFLGTAQYIFGTRRRSHAKRVIRKDEQGQLYVYTDGQKAIVEWNPIVRGLEIKHWEGR